MTIYHINYLIVWFEIVRLTSCPPPTSSTPPTRTVAAAYSSPHERMNGTDVTTLAWQRNVSRGKSSD